MIAIRKILIIRAANQAMAFSIPTLAAVLSFVTYGSTQENLDPVGVLISVRILIRILLTPLGGDFHFFGFVQSTAPTTDVSPPRSVDSDRCSDCRSETRPRMVKPEILRCRLPSDLRSRDCRHRSEDGSWLGCGLEIVQGRVSVGDAPR